MTFIQLLWLLLGSSWTLLEIGIAIKTRVSDLGAEQQKYRSEKLIWLVVIVSLIVALAFKHLHWLALPIPYFQRQLIALLLLSLGLGLRFYAIVSLGRFFSTTATTQQQHVLIESGPYRWVRHPAYTGLIINFFAAGLAMGDGLAMLCLLCPLAYVLQQRIKVEEQVLIEHFGQLYYDYCGRTKKLMPWLF